MPTAGPTTSRYSELRSQLSQLESEWVAMFRSALSPSAIDRLLFDAIAFKKLAEQIDLLDAELVQIETIMHDTEQASREAEGEGESEKPAG